MLNIKSTGRRVHFVLAMAGIQLQLASCLINGWPLPANEMGKTNQLSGRGIVVSIRSFIEPDLFDNNVPFDNTTPIYHHHHHHADIYNAPITTKQEHRCSTKIQIVVDETY